MNAPVLNLSVAPRRYKVADIQYLVERGLIHESANFELIEGEIRDMASKGIAHEVMKAELNEWFVRNLGERFWIMVETSLYLSDDTFLEPDFLLVPKAADGSSLKASPTQREAVLAVELSASSKAYDFGEKAMLYAKYGVREYWAIDVHTREARMHRSPSGGEWGGVDDIAPGQPLTPLCAPDVALRLA